MFSQKREELINVIDIPSDLVNYVFTLEDIIVHEATSYIQIERLEKLISGVRDDMDNVMAKVLYISSVIGVLTKVFEEQDLYAHAGNFKEVVGWLEKRKCGTKNKVKGLGQWFSF